MKWRDLFGVLMLVVGVGGCMTGVRGFSGDAWWGAPAIGAGVVVNAIAYRAMRPTRVERKKNEEREVAATSALAEASAGDEPPPESGPVTKS